MASGTAETCVTCGQPVATRFCPECGEMRASDRNHSVVTFVREHVLEALLSFDGRLIRTVKALLLKPGELTAAFMRGTRTPYLAPLQCFLLFNVAFFLASPGVLDFPLRQQLRDTPWRRTAQRLVLEHIQKQGIDYTVFAAKFNAVTSTQARSLVILMVPVFALVMWLLLIRRRRPLVHHLVYALHTYSFFFVGLPIALFLVALPVYKISGSVDQDSVYTTVAMITLFIYLGLSARRTYSISWLHAIAIAIIGLFGVTQIMVWYRHLMLYVTLRTM